MILGEIFERFAQESALSVIVRGLLEQAKAAKLANPPP